MVKSSKQEIIDTLVANNIRLIEKIIEMTSNVNKLTKKIDQMVDIFDEAAKNIKSDTNEPLIKKLEDLLEQNRNLSRGLILLEKYVREKTSTSNFPPRPLPQTNL